MRVVTTADGGQLFGAESMWYLKYGRGPGKFPPKQRMIDSIEARGIVPEQGTSIEQLAFLFARKIARFGTDIFMGKRKGVDIDEPFETRTAKFIKDIGKRFTLNVVDKLKKVASVVLLCVLLSCGSTQQINGVKYRKPATEQNGKMYAVVCVVSFCVLWYSVHNEKVID